MNFNFNYNAAVTTIMPSANSTTYQILALDSKCQKVYRLLIIIENNEISYKFHDFRGHHTVSWQDLKTILHMNYETPMGLIDKYHQMFDGFDKMGGYGKFRCRLQEILNANSTSNNTQISDEKTSKNHVDKTSFC